MATAALVSESRLQGAGQRLHVAVCCQPPTAAAYTRAGLPPCLLAPARLRQAHPPAWAPGLVNAPPGCLPPGAFSEGLAGLLGCKGWLSPAPGLVGGMIS